MLCGGETEVRSQELGVRRMTETTLRRGLNPGAPGFNLCASVALSAFRDIRVFRGTAKLAPTVSQTISKAFPSVSQFIPNSFPSHSQVIPKSFPSRSQLFLKCLHRLTHAVFLRNFAIAGRFCRTAISKN
jgi:hypothetical protein